MAYLAVLRVFKKYTPKALGWVVRQRMRRLVSLAASLLLLILRADVVSSSSCATLTASVSPTQVNGSTLSCAETGCVMQSSCGTLSAVWDCSHSFGPDTSLHVYRILCDDARDILVVFTDT